MNMATEDYPLYYFNIGVLEDYNNDKNHPTLSDQYILGLGRKELINFYL